MFPSVKVMIAVSSAVGAGAFLGPKLGAKLVGPELDGKDAAINNVKEYAAIMGVGLATYVAMHLILKL